MISLYRRADKKLRKLTNAGVPGSSDFASIAKDEDRSTYRGRAADIFFQTRGSPLQSGFTISQSMINC